MAERFLTVINMSISASWLVLAVIVLRLLLKRSPRWIHVLLWGIVAVRLICPFTIESALSLIPSTETIRPEIMMDWEPEIDTGFTVLNETVNPVITETFAPEPAASANPLQILIPVASLLWLAGIAVLLTYTVASYWLLKRKVAAAVLQGENIYQSEFVTTPFVLGIVKPKIYLPYTMSQTDRSHVISHEKAHIRRRDHWWKPLGFLLLAVHWFNPVMWIAYHLFGKDIELACDEHVIRNMDNDQRADYAQALLSCSVNRHLVAACPIAFGEVGVKTRIKSVLNYKRPTFWLILVAVLACIVLAVCFLTDPKTENTAAQGIADDFAYHLELVVPGKTYRDMDSQKKEAILSEYGDLLDDYTLIARESTDGAVSFIAGCYNGAPGDNPLSDMAYFVYGEDFTKILGTEEEIQAAAQAQEAGQPFEARYSIQDSFFWHDTDNESGIILIEPKDSSTSMLFAYTRYLQPNGGEYIVDAASRGIALYSTPNSLAVRVFSEEWGMINERIPLTDEQVAQILSEERVVISGEGYNFDASMLYYIEETDDIKVESFGGDQGVTRTVIDLVEEKCNFRFESPQYIQSDIVEARLDCDWLDGPLYAKDADLPKLKSILTGAKLGTIGFNTDAKITIRMADGREMVIFKCEEGRYYHGFAFGSGNGYYLEPEEAEELWRIFGLDPSTMEPITATEEAVATEPDTAAPVHEEVADLAWYMELSAFEKEFQPMDDSRQETILSEYGGLLDGYDLIARESTDGELSYIVGYWGGNVEESTLYHLRTSSRDDGDREEQLLYDVRDLEAADKYEEPEYKCIIHNSHINHSSSTGYFLIHPTDSGWGFNDVFNKYLRPNGREYLMDAFTRGIAIATPAGPYLEVSLISPQWGEIYEMIPLSEEQVSQITAEDRQKLESGHGFVARLEPGPNSALNLDSDALYYTESTGVPQTVLDLAVEKCGYTFATPKDIQSPIAEAKLDCSWLEEPIYAEESDLSRLQSILENAEFGFIGKCGYGAKLTISMEDGTELVLFKGTDSCDTMVFGSYGGYFIGDEENTEFWDMFGIDIEAAWN